jgi:hypothetical protein
VAMWCRFWVVESVFGLDKIDVRVKSEGGGRGDGGKRVCID